MDDARFPGFGRKLSGRNVLAVWIVVVQNRRRIFVKIDECNNENRILRQCWGFRVRKMEKIGEILTNLIEKNHLVAGSQ